MKNKFIPLILFSSFILTGCNWFNNTSTVNTNQTTDNNNNFNSEETTSNSSSNSSSSESTNNNDDDTATSTKPTLRYLNESTYGWRTSATTGNQKILIIPVQLKQSSRSNIEVPTWTDEMLSDINTAFFGSSEETNFESVSSFYEKSSYGKLHLSGEIAPVFESSYYASTNSISDTKSLSNYGTESSDYIIEEYYEYCDQDLLKEYDLDDDGFVDNAVFLYSNDAANSEAYWAWCYVHDKEAEKDKTLINNYMWVSYSFCKETYNDGYNDDKVDAHTYIHETGHLLGLDDYYNADNGWDPAGECDMETYNVGDQSIYPKLALGWANATYANEAGSYTLHPSESTGECLLIKDNWNGSPFDEYILVEYYTPTGLNETDAEHQYASRKKMYSESGLRIYHVDARLINIAISSDYLDPISYVKDINNLDTNYAHYVASSNTPSHSFVNYVNYTHKSLSNKFVNLHLIDEGGHNSLTFQNPSINNDETIWTEGTTFTPSRKYFYNCSSSRNQITPLFNDGSALNYSISVSNVNDASCTVTLTNIN